MTEEFIKPCLCGSDYCNHMDDELRAKIEQHHGWDFCDHERIRRFCNECKWDVPAFMRRGDPKNIRIAVPADEEVNLAINQIPAEAK